MRSIAPALFASLLLTLPASAGEMVHYAPDHTGEMSITYRPLMCVKSPCPPGKYLIEGSEPFEVRAKTVILNINGEYAQYTGQYLDFKDFVGGVWIGGEDAVDQHGVSIPENVVYVRVGRIHKPGR